MERKDQLGFTLIELLIVLAVIAVLTAILFPEFAQTRETARQGSCLSNLHQIAIANELFAPTQEDYDHAELILDAYDYCTSEAGGKKGSAMLGDEMIDEASRKMALVIAGKGRTAGMQRTSSFTAPEEDR